MFKTIVELESDNYHGIYDTKTMTHAYYLDLCIEFYDNCGNLNPPEYGHLIETAVFMNHVHKIHFKEWWMEKQHELLKRKIKNHGV